MDFNLTKEQQEFKNSVRKFLQKEAPKELMRKLDEEKIYPEEIFKKMADAGFRALPVPKEYGGLGGSFFDISLLLEELGRCSLALCTLYITTCVFGTYSLLLFGSEEQKNNYLPKIAEGKLKFALCATEPEAGSDFANLKTSATKNGENYIISGQKTFISGANQADVLIVAARTDKTVKKHKGITIFLVDRNSKGIIMKAIDKLGMGALETNEIYFNDVKVSEKNIFGELNKGFYNFAGLMDYERIAASSQFIGLAEAILEEALDYAKKRVQFEKPIGSFQAISHLLADAFVELNVARLFVRYCAWKRTQGEPAPIEASQAKLYSSNMVWKIAQIGMQVMGSYGYRMDVDMQRYFREAKGAELGGGTSQIQKNIIARHLGLI